MRVHQIVLRNFRGISHAEISFADGVTVIEGPNEIGKSSIAEAFRVIRDYKANSRHRDIQALKPVDQDVGPEVEIKLSAGDYRVNYAKRWLHRARTALTISTPRPEQHTGDEAHERFNQILAETIDLNLLAALDVVQGNSLAQAQLAAIPALRRALDDSAADATEHDELLARVKSEYVRYFTSRTAQATGEYRQAITELEQAKSNLECQRERSKEMDSLVGDHEEALSVLEQTQQQLAEAKQALEQCQAEHHRLDGLRDTAEASAQRVSLIEQQLADARARLDSRTAQINDLTERMQQIAELKNRLADLTLQFSTEQSALDKAVQTAASCEFKRDRIRAEAHQIEEYLHRSRDQAEYYQLNVRLKQVQEAEQQRRSAIAQIIDNRIDAAMLKQIIEHETNLRVAIQSQEQASATIHVHRLGDPQISIDGEPIEHECHSPVLQPTRIEVAGIVRVEVDPGIAPRDIDQQIVQAREALYQVLQVAGVTSVGEARDAAHQRAAAEAEREKAESVLSRLLETTSLEELIQRQDVLAQRLNDLLDDACVPTPNDLEKRADTIKADLEQAESLLAHTRATIERARSAVDSAREEQVRVAATLELAEEEHDKAEQRLIRVRAEETDEGIARTVVTLENELERYRDRSKRDAAELAAADPDTIEMLLNNATARVERIRKDVDTSRDRVTKVEAVLADRTRQGVYDELSEAKATHAAAKTRHDRLAAAAEAARLLYLTLNRCREQAQRRYVRPLQIGIERLGRVVFGPDFTVQISDDLVIESRTLDGRTVAFDSLSAGAKEQLALIGRLACAQLIDPGEGAPIILDDTLGFADPHRLVRVNAVLHEVGGRAQVILLTCQPQRFSSLGEARIVRLGQRRYDVL